MAMNSEELGLNQTKNYFYQEKIRDGRTLFIRAIRSDDKASLEEIMRHLSDTSRFFRFFIPKDTLTDEELAKFTDIDFTHQVGLLASVFDNGNYVPAGTAAYMVLKNDGPKDKKVAELSFMVEEEFQGFGIGSLLLKHLTIIARTQAITQFIALVQVANHKMLEVFAHSGLPMTQSLGELGVVEVKLTL